MNDLRLLTLFFPILFLGCSQGDNSFPERNVTGVTIDNWQTSEQRISVTDTNTQIPETTLQRYNAFVSSRYIDDSSLEINSAIMPFDELHMLAMVALGADGNSLAELTTASMLDLSFPENHAALGVWEQTVDSLDSINRQRDFWGQSRYRFAKTYLQSLTDYYSPHVTGTDFINATGEAEALITDKYPDVAHEGKINDKSRLLIGQLSQLNSGWHTDDINVEEFTGRFINHNSEQQQWVPMVRLEGMMNASKTDDYRVVDIPLNDSEISLVIVEPGENNISVTRDNFNESFFRDIVQQLTPTQTSISLPLFTVSRINSQIKQPLPDSLFDENSADFFKINNAGFLYLNSWYQSLNFDLNAVGVTGQSQITASLDATDDEPIFLTGPVINTGGNWFGVSSSSSSISSFYSISFQSCFYPPDQLPFLYFVYHHTTGAILYMGHVTTLTGEEVLPDWEALNFDQCTDVPPS